MLFATEITSPEHAVEVYYSEHSNTDSTGTCEASEMYAYACRKNIDGRDNEIQITQEEMTRVYWRKCKVETGSFQSNCYSNLPLLSLPTMHRK